MLLLVTGLPSSGKNRLVDALADRLGPNQVVAGWLPGAHAGNAVLHVHAETDLEALLEGEWPDRRAAEQAELVVRVDWEPIEASIDRVMQTLQSRAIGSGAR
jgi:hypothetical protein